MLVITRKRGDAVVLGDGIVISVVEVRGDKVRLGIIAPAGVSVHRQEVYDAIHVTAPPPRSAEEVAFVQAVLESPDDEGIRLIYADWLQERDDPLGEFIRAQCHLARLPPTDGRRT